MASTAIRAKLGFLGFDPLDSAVIAALGADTMRTLHALATWTALDGDCRRFLVSVAGALLPLGCAALRDGHESSVGEIKDQCVVRSDESVVRTARGPQLGPSCIDSGRATASTRVALRA